MKLLYEIRGWRNNNPGNIEKGQSRWNGLSDTQTDPRFCMFISPEYGIRVVRYLLQKYQKSYGLKTVRELINKYAPSTENDTNSYIDHVSSLMATNPDLVIDTFNEILIVDLVSAIIIHECGCMPYSRDVILSGVRLK